MGAVVPGPGGRRRCLTNPVHDHSRATGTMVPMEGTIVPRCPRRTRSGAACAYPAGLGTNHPGHGSCNRHGGSWPKSEEMWRQAMEIANREDITPTDALLGMVRSAVGRASYVDGILAEAMRKHIEAGGDPLEPPKEIKPWLAESRLERKLAAQTAKWAVDAGVMTALAQRLDLEGGLVADALTAALDALGLSSEDRMRALGAAQERLMVTE